jgi:RNA polymerase sigma-70 factor (ECF subfamily)
MLRIAKRDSKSIEQLYDRYSPLLYTLIKRITGEKETAEEILSEVFIIIWKRIDHFNPDTSSVFTWLVTLARNKTIDVLKRKKGDAHLPEYSNEYETEHILPKLSPAIKQLELGDVLKNSDKLLNALKGLTDAQKLVLSLSYFEGLDEKEVAEELHIPAVTVKSKLQVAMGMLLQKLKESHRDSQEILLNRDNGKEIKID